jgi:hypothetical protein
MTFHNHTCLSIQVIFGLCVVEIYKSGGTTRSLYGIIEVPSKYYPWILLVVLQFIIPNVSFMGHLSGIVIGTLQTYNFHLLPSVGTYV